MAVVPAAGETGSGLRRSRSAEQPVKHLILAVTLLAFPAAAAARTANVSLTSPSGTGSGNATRAAPSGSTAIPNPGQPQVGAPTPTEGHDEHRAQKAATSVCKGC